MNVIWFFLGIIVGAIIGAVVAFLINYLMGKKIKHDDIDLGDGDIPELIGRIQHVTSVNVDTLEKKITELRTAIHMANQIYAKLIEQTSESMNVFVDDQKVSKNDARTFEEEKIISFEEKGFKPLTKEERVIELKKKGWNAHKIAESLEMGVGEVELIIEIKKEEDRDK